MASIELRAVEKWYGEVQVIKGVDLAIEEGEFIIFDCGSFAREASPKFEQRLWVHC